MAEEEDPPAVLLMGYGSPRRDEDLPEYLRDVLGGKAPSPAMVEEYERRYALIGGSPQNRVLESLRAKVEQQLASDGSAIRVYLGTKHWTPHITSVVPAIAADGYSKVVAVPLSPYASTWIMEPYTRAIDKGIAAATQPIEVEIRSGWHLHPGWIGYWRDALKFADPSGDHVVLLSAHSLPKRFYDGGDPYPRLLDATSRAIAGAAERARWSFTFQSAGNTTEPWLGPDITEVLLEWKGRGVNDPLIASFGFVFDHLETLYDLDVVVRAFAEKNGIEYRRIPMPNDHDRVAAALADIVRGASTTAG
ncbi:MAG TPA: ferrochelatase [Thermoplasmata archaeon]|nr:ferrochelatase [Thermoplasmata archaeon]